MITDNTDKELLNLLQTNFPLCKRPYLQIGNELGIGEGEVIKRIELLKNNGYLRRLSGVFNSSQLGYVSTLCAIKVPYDRIDEVGNFINSFKGVTHNYLRNHEYNMWFTLIEPTKEDIEKTIREIESSTGINDILNLPAKKVFKINVNFNMKGE